VRAVLGHSRSVSVFLGCTTSNRFRSKWSEGQTEGTAVAIIMKSPGARQRGVLMTPAKYEVDRSTGSEVMGIFCKLRN